MKVKVGVIGCGSIARMRHIPELNSNPNAEIVAVCDYVKQNTEKISREYHVKKTYTDYKDMLETSELDAVYVCATNILHAKMTVDALQAGKHVLCEKPMATNLEDAKKMIETADKTGKFLMIGHNQRLSPANKKAKEIIKSGRLGKMLTFNLVFGHQGCDYWVADKLDTWFFKKEQSGFGSSADLGIHKADLIRWLLGEEIVGVSAIAGAISKKDGNGHRIPVDDNAVCLLKSASGVIGTLTSSWTYAREENATTLHFENGEIRIGSDPYFDLVVNLKNGASESYKFAAANQRSGVTDTFINCIMSEKKPDISGSEGYRALKIIIACHQSSNEKRAIIIDN